MTPVIPLQQQPLQQKRHHHHSKHHRNSSNGQNYRRSTEAPIISPPPPPPPPIPQQLTIAQTHSPVTQATQVSTNLHNLNITQQHINAALFNVNTPSASNSSCYGTRLVNPVQPIRSPKTQIINELHMAEKLVESAAQQQKNAFQFDTDTPKRGAFKSNDRCGGKSNVGDAILTSPDVASVVTLSGMTPPTTTTTASSTNVMNDSGIGMLQLFIHLNLFFTYFVLI